MGYKMIRTVLLILVITLFGCSENNEKQDLKSVKPIFDVPKILESKESVIDYFGNEGDCFKEPFKGLYGLNCYYQNARVYIFYFKDKPISFSINRGGFEDFRKIEMPAFGLLGIDSILNGDIEVSNKHVIRWVSKSMNLEVSLFGDGTGKLTAANNS